MSSSTDSTAAVERPRLPDGVKHYETAGFAQSWEAYNALTAEDGWHEHSVSKLSWKQRHLSEGFLTVHQPLEAVR